MKRAILSLLLGFVLSSTSAQSWRTPFTKTVKSSEGIREYQYFHPHLSKSGIAVSYGYQPVSSLDWWSQSTMKSRPNAYIIYDNKGESNSGALSVIYSNQLKPWLELTIPFTYSHSNGTLYEINNTTNVASSRGSYADNFFFLTPQVKISWLYNRFFHLYSRAGIGLGLCNRSEGTNGGTTINSKLAFSWQVSPIGIELGQRVSFFTEAGFGQMGVVNAGLKVRFNSSKDQSGRIRNEGIAAKHAWYKDMLR